MKSFTDRLRETLEKSRNDPFLDTAQTLSYVALGLSILGFTIVVIRAIIHFSG